MSGFLQGMTGMVKSFPESRFSILTLGASDKEMLTRFYTDILGFRRFGPDEMTMLDAGGLVLGIWEREKLAADAGQAAPPPREGFPGFALAYNARSREEVDEIFARLGENGVAITKPPHDTFWGGYGGYFRDPENNAWEVVFNPFWPIAADGRLTLPEA